MGQRGGSENASIDVPQLPAHNHPAHGADAADSASPGGGRFGVADSEHYAAGGPFVAMNGGVIGANPTAAQSHPNMAPFRAINFIIALFGVYPSRS